jgi:hypothetical protein
MADYDAMDEGDEPSAGSNIPVVECKYGHDVAEIACRSLEESVVLFFRRRRRVASQLPRSVHVRCPTCETEKRPEPISIIPGLTLDYCREIGFLDRGSD